MDRSPRVAVALAMVVGLLAVPTAGLVADVPGDALDGDGVDSSAGTPGTTVADDARTEGDATGSDGSPTGAGASDRTDRDGGTTAGEGTTAGDEPSPAAGDPAPADTATANAAVNGTPNRLSVGGGRVVDGFATPNPDLSATLSAGDGEFKGVYVAYLVRERMAAAETDGERQTVFREALDLIERRVESLRSREAVAIRAYQNGTIDRQELLRRLGSIDAEAGALRASLADLQTRRPFLASQFETTIFSLDRDLRSLEGPVRDRVGRVLSGQAGTTRAHVSASDTGLVLEMIDGGLYVREAVRLDHYAPESPPEYGISDILNRLQTLYPDTITETNPVDTLDSVGDRLFVVTKSHPTGSLTMYVDRSLGEVYREVQQLRLEGLPNSTVGTSAHGELRLVVNRTDGGNPYRVQVYDATTGDPVDAPVTVAGETVGRTGDDGVLWTLGPRGSFDVSTTVGNDRLNVTVPG